MAGGRLWQRALARVWRWLITHPPHRPHPCASQAMAWAGETGAPVACMGGDLDGANGFTLGDALFVARVWAREAQFAWAGESPST